MAMKKHYLLLLFLFTYVAQAQIINIPDANFKAKLLSYSPVIDTNSNGQIEVSEALQVQTLNIYSSNIASLEGIQYFTSLLRLDCNNNNLTTLNINSLTSLNYLDCSNNALTSLNASQINNTLSYFNCNFNNLTSLVVPNMFPFLDMGLQNIRVFANHNQLTTITFAGTPEDLTVLDIANNNFTSLTLSNIIIYSLGYVNLSNNPFTNLNFNQFVFAPDSDGSGGALIVNDTNLAEITIPNMGVKQLSIQNNPNLISINLKNNNPDIFLNSGLDPPYICSDYDGLIFSNNPQLGLICCDANEENTMSCFAPNVQVTSYCTFLPGGNYNTISGNVNYNCPSTSTATANVKVVLNNGDSTTFVDSSNNYIAYTGINSQTASLQLEHPAYFTVTPPSYSYTFLNFGNTPTANFCIAPNGVHPDVSVSMLPITPARPGFSASYKIVYKNNGTETQSGMVNLSFNDAVLDLVAALPTISAQSTNSLSWNFTALAPFETRTINVTLNVNSPQQVPAVNIGTVLPYTVTITTAATDETPSDNSMNFEQTVVGSYDPNDKTVVEGQIIIEPQLDDYLHYIVRFQNTGTFPAENVVVKDMLSYYLDWNTLEMVSSSHTFRSTRANGNQLEVFYEGINLPAAATDEPASHGYIAFKIKPVSWLTVNDIIENTANIYFDYNFPIVTNTVSTGLVVLGTSNYDRPSFTLYPNPTTGELQINLPTGTNIKTIGIYNTLGQKLVTFTNSTTIDVSILSQGTYFVTVETASGKATQRFVKL